MQVRKRNVYIHIYIYTSGGICIHDSMKCICNQRRMTRSLRVAHVHLNVCVLLCMLPYTHKHTCIRTIHVYIRTRADTHTHRVAAVHVLTTYTYVSVMNDGACVHRVLHMLRNLESKHFWPGRLAVATPHCHAPVENVASLHCVRHYPTGLKLSWGP